LRDADDRTRDLVPRRGRHSASVDGARPGARGPVLIECKVSAQAAGKTTSYPCEITNLVLIAGDRISDTLWRAKDRTLEYHRY
jgi:hypothetical protein